MSDSRSPNKLFLSTEDLLAEEQRSTQLEALAGQEAALTEAVKDGLASIEEVNNSGDTHQANTLQE